MAKANHIANLDARHPVTANPSIQSALEAVLIPSRSGHAFKLGVPRTPTCTTGLNPFEIRARVQTLNLSSPYAWAAVLIPSRSGHAFKPFRCAVYFGRGPRLNPFEIRARVQTRPLHLTRGRRNVLIPSRSGHAFKRHFRARSIGQSWS